MKKRLTLELRNKKPGEVPRPHGGEGRRERGKGKAAGAGPARLGSAWGPRTAGGGGGREAAALCRGGCTGPARGPSCAPPSPGAAAVPVPGGSPGMAAGGGRRRAEMAPAAPGPPNMAGAAPRTRLGHVRGGPGAPPAPAALPAARGRHGGAWAGRGGPGRGLRAEGPGGGRGVAKGPLVGAPPGSRPRRVPAAGWIASAGGCGCLRARPSAARGSPSAAMRCSSARASSSPGLRYRRAPAAGWGTGEGSVPSPGPLLANERDVGRLQPPGCRFQGTATLQRSSAGCAFPTAGDPRPLRSCAEAARAAWAHGTSPARGVLVGERTWLLTSGVEIPLLGPHACERGF